MLRSYTVFTSIPYRIAVWGLIPAGLVAVAAWSGSKIGDLALVLPLMILVLTEVFSDSWLFGGIQTKDSEKRDYLKCSGRGMAVMSNALTADMIRKLFTALAVASVSYFLIGRVKGGAAELPALAINFISVGETAQEIGLLGYLVLLSYSFSVLGTFLSRYGSTVYINMMLGYGTMMLAGLAGIYGPMLLGYPSNSVFLLDLLAAAAGGGISIAAVRAAMKKVKGGYYDE